MRIFKSNFLLTVFLLITNQCVIAQDDGSFTTSVGMWWWGGAYGCYGPQAPYQASFEGITESGTYAGGEPDFCIGAGGSVSFPDPFTFRAGQSYKGHLFAFGGLEIAQLVLGGVPDCVSAIITGGTAQPNLNWPSSVSFNVSFEYNPDVTPSVNWQIKDATGNGSSMAPQNQGYTLPADGMSQAIGIDTDPTATFTISGDTADCSFSSGGGVATLTAGTKSGSVTVTATDHNTCQAKSFSFTFVANPGPPPGRLPPPGDPPPGPVCSSCAACINPYSLSSVDLRFTLGPALNGGNACVEVESG